VGEKGRREEEEGKKPKKKKYIITKSKGEGSRNTEYPLPSVSSS
jgi:hypothetical protein